jgi:CheY-like chemotaxis protein
VLERAGNRLRLAVTDTGAGVPTEFLPFVFERFRQADASSKRRFGGLGLGLALVKGLVEAHGGRVEVSSPGVGMGACFVIELPVRAVRAAQATTVATAPERGARLAGMRILVVDDHPDALDLVETILADEGAKVTTAATGAQAMELLHAAPGRPDAVVCDIGLPDEDGYQVVARIRDRERALGWTPRLPVIALTAFTRPQERARALAAGFDAQMSKPVDPDALVSELARVATRGRSVGVAGE